MEVKRIDTKTANTLISKTFSLVIDNTRYRVYRNTVDTFFEHAIIVSKTCDTCFHLIFTDCETVDYLSFVDFLII